MVKSTLADIMGGENNDDATPKPAPNPVGDNLADMPQEFNTEHLPPSFAPGSLNGLNTPTDTAQAPTSALAPTSGPLPSSGDALSEHAPAAHSPSSGSSPTSGEFPAAPVHETAAFPASSLPETGQDGVHAGDAQNVGVAHGQNGVQDAGVQNQEAQDAQNADAEPVASKKKEPKNLVLVPKTYRDGSIKTDKNGEVKNKRRIAKFMKDGSPKLLLNGKQKLGWTNLRKGITSALAVLLVGVLTALGMFAYLFFKVEDNLQQGAISGNLADILTRTDPLQQDQYDRTNVLIFGTSENDMDYGGAQLADTIMVLSVNQSTGEANTISVPRDLSFQDDSVSAGGQIRCDLGSKWKLNAAYYCGMQMSNATNDKDKHIDASKHLSECVGEVLGIDIQYFVKMDWDGVISIVDAIGGIEVKPHTQTPELGIYDVNTGLRISPEQIANGMHVDGITALTLSRARNSDGGYGLPDSNFDREQNQQIILQATRDKALSVGTLSSPQKILELTDALGSHILTNIETSEVRSFANAMKLMDKAIPLPFMANDIYGDKVRLMVPGASTSAPFLGSVVLPAQGEYQYSDIQKYISDAFKNGGKPSKQDETVGGSTVGTTE
jgi:LCP family protein required for cell wall assembly